MHACLVVENDNQTIVVDPGNFSSDFMVPNNVKAVVVTHEHPDHFDARILEKIISTNPTAVVVAPKSITEQLTNMETLAVVASDEVNIESFKLNFYGGQHANIYQTLPQIANVGVLINDSLYYPGDSFAVPDKPVRHLALPVSAPWMKLAESIDFLNSVQPTYAFPTHDAILSDAGKSIVDRLLPQLSNQSEYRRLDGQTIVLE